MKDIVKTKIAEFEAQLEQARNNIVAIQGAIAGAKLILTEIEKQETEKQSELPIESVKNGASSS